MGTEQEGTRFLAIDTTLDNQQAQQFNTSSGMARPVLRACGGRSTGGRRQSSLISHALARGEGHNCGAQLMAWREDNDSDYISGLYVASRPTVRLRDRRRHLRGAPCAAHARLHITRQPRRPTSS